MSSDAGLVLLAFLSTIPRGEARLSWEKPLGHVIPRNQEGGLEIHQAKQRRSLFFFNPSTVDWLGRGGQNFRGCGDGAHRGSKDLALKP